MPLQPQDSPLGAFLKALREEGIDSILIGAMAAIQQGAPLMTLDYDFWVRLPERRYVHLLTIVKRQGGTIRAATLYELSDGTQVNAIFQPDGLRSFAAEWKNCRWGELENVRVKVLPLHRVIVSKRAAGREKDLAVLPILRRTLRLARRLQRSRSRQMRASRHQGKQPPQDKKQ
jgi:hypothetical protein